MYSFLPQKFRMIALYELHDYDGIKYLVEDFCFVLLFILIANTEDSSAKRKVNLFLVELRKAEKY